jgi:hypothetical protein
MNRAERGHASLGARSRVVMALTGAVAATCILVAILGLGCSDQARDLSGPPIALRPQIVRLDSTLLDSLRVHPVGDSLHIWLPVWPPDSLSVPRPESVP